jgi:8-oxo-dGTP diphosphatase
VGQRRRRIGAYGVCRDDHGRVLLVRGSVEDVAPGRWYLPGGGVEHGEHPRDAVVREFVEETGLDIEVAGLRDALTDLIYPDGSGVEIHNDRLVFDVCVADGARGRQLRFEVGGTSDLARWVSPDELGELALMEYAAAALGVAAQPVINRPDASDASDALVAAGPPPQRVQRFGAYGFVTDPAGRVLLTKIAPTYPGAGSWHLPGGGTEFGESPPASLLRELVEETGQAGRVIALLGLSHGYHPGTLGPEGYPLDWHTVRVHYRVAVDVPTAAVVTEAAGGSTAEAAWFTPVELRRARLTRLAAEVLEEQLRS